MTHNTGVDHVRDENVILAARFYSELKAPLPIPVAELKTRYGLTSLQAVEAMRLAQQMKTYRAAHG